MIFEEKTVSSDYKFKGRIINVRVDTVAMPDGHTATREVVEHGGGVGIVPVTDNGEIILVRQFRKPLEQAIIEVLAGKLEKSEDHFDCARRELEEETGFLASEFKYLGYNYPTPGYACEVIHLYMATGLYPGTAHLDHDEFLDVLTLPVGRVIKMIMSGEIRDSKTVIGVFKARELLNLR